MFTLKCSLVVGSVFAVPDGEWESWKQQYFKVYNGNDEDSYRRSVYEQNLEIYAEVQKRNPQAKFGPTQFSDMTPSEFKNTMLTYKPSNRTLTHADLSHLPAVASDKDWTGIATTPVKDQGQCGSCWAFSAVEQIESDYMLQGGQEVVLSTQQMNDCTSSGAGSRRGGCSGGDPAEAFGVVEAIGGLASESTYGPYTARDGTCRTPTAAVQISDWQWVGQRSESQMQSYVGSQGPLSVCVDANDWNGYQGGVMTSCGNNVDHCVQVVGISGSTWKVRNSWGSGWGEGGYIRLEAGRNLCDITSEPSKVTTVGGSPTPSPSPSPSPSPGCVDLDDSSDCSYWKSSGYCSSSSQYYSYMQEHCCDTCGFGEFGAIQV